MRNRPARGIFPRRRLAQSGKMHETLLKDGFDILASDLGLKFPFFQYALQNVLFHADRSQQNGISQQDFLATFPLQRWLLHKNTLEIHWIRRYTFSATLLYILAERNLCHLIRAIQLRESCLAKGTERYGAALFAALATKSTEAAETLLELEISSRSSPISIKREEEQEAPRRMKITMVLDRDFTFTQTRTVLSYVAAGGDEALVKLLLSYGTDPDKPDYRGRTALQFAAENGHEGVVRILLPEVHGHDKSTVGILFEPTRGEQDDYSAVPMADPHRCDRSGITPLMMAARGGHKGVGEVLLDKGMVDVNAVDHYCRTALNHAAAEGHEVFVKMLLGRDGCDLRPDDRGCTPLIWAASRGRKEVVRLLLELNDDDADTEDDAGRTALSWAAQLGGDNVTGIVKLL